MKILLDEKKVVIAWQTVGGGWSDSEYTTIEVEAIPEEVKKADSGYYLYIDGEYIENPDYVPPVDESVDYDEVALDHEFRISMLELGI